MCFIQIHVSQLRFRPLPGRFHVLRHRRRHKRLRGQQRRQRHPQEQREGPAIQQKCEYLFFANYRYLLLVAKVRGVFNLLDSLMLSFHYWREHVNLCTVYQ